MSNDFNEHYFFVKPLNNIANFTIILTCIHAILCMVVLFQFTIGQAAWSLGVIGIVFNFALIIMQIIKCFQTRKFVKNSGQIIFISDARVIGYFHSKAVLVFQFDQGNLVRAKNDF